jgi:hypothetical protein
MGSDEPFRERREAAADPVQAAGGAWPAAGSQEAADGGDPACWACLVCQECGAVTSEGHRTGCPCVSGPAGPLQAGL